MNDRELTQILTVLKSTYTHRFDVNDATRSAWRTLVGDLDYAAVNNAVTSWMLAGEEWPPVPTAIRKSVLDATSGLPTPGEAWLMVLQRMKSTYPGMPAEKWDAPQEVQDALKDIGGMHLLRQIDRADDARKRFDKAYTERVDRSRRTTPELGANAMKELLG